MLRFYLNHEQVALDGARADLTILDYLREHRRKVGTKEGCASGDCGACTVVVAEVDGDGLRYRSLNSCIAFAGALHGKMLICVEDLAKDGRLHPVQRAVVDRHASQCGFCTPGFVMSLFALYKNRGRPGRETTEAPRHLIESYLAGNLCRCTGYRPIIDAARQATREAGADHFSRREGEMARQLTQLKRLRRPPEASHFHQPRSARRLAGLLGRHPGARLLAGGTDLGVEATQDLKPLDEIIFVGRVAELTRIRPCAGHIEIGAAVTLADCGDLLCAEYPGLAELLHRFGGMQVRNMATLGGNIANASPVADLPPALMALGAQLKLQHGARIRKIALEEFFLDYKKTALAAGEFIRSVVLPRAAPGASLHAYKVSKRMDDDIAALCAAFNVRVEDGVFTAVRIAFGGMAATPKRAPHCEQALLGRPLAPHTLETARRALCRDFQPISDARAGAAYRMTVAQNLLDRLFLELPGERLHPAPAIATRIGAHFAA